MSVSQLCLSLWGLCAPAFISLWQFSRGSILCMHLSAQVLVCVCVSVCVCVCVCVCVACHTVRSYEHVSYGHSLEAAHFTNVCGSPVFWASCVCVVRSRTESSPLLHLRVCLNASVCGVVKGWKESLGSHGNKWQDLVVVSSICKKMKETKLVKTGAETFARTPTEISLQRQMVSWWSPVCFVFLGGFFWSLHLPSEYVT